ERYHKAYEALGWDLAYVNLFDRRADKVAADLKTLEHSMSEPDENALRREALRELEEYRAMVGLPTVDLAYAEVRAKVEELKARTGDIVNAVASESANLEERTWDTIVIAFAVGIVAALASAGFLAVRITRDLARLSAAA